MPWASSADSVFSSAVFSRDNLSKIAATLALPSLVYALGFAPHFTTAVCSTVMCRTVVCSTVVCSTVVCSTVVCSTVVCSNVVCSAVVCSTVVCSNVVCSAVVCSNVVCSAVVCSTVAMVRQELEEDSVQVQRLHGWGWWRVETCKELKNLS